MFPSETHDVFFLFGGTWKSKKIFRYEKDININDH